MSQHIVETIWHVSGKRRVIIFRRDDESFGFEEQSWSDEPMELAWLPYGRYAVSHCESFAIALREAKGRVAWIAELDLS